MERLAQRQGVAQREVLERLIAEADAAVIATLEPDAPEWAEYLGHRAVTRRSDVTA